MTITLDHAQNRNAENIFLNIIGMMMNSDKNKAKSRTFYLKSKKDFGELVFFSSSIQMSRIARNMNIISSKRRMASIFKPFDSFLFNNIMWVRIFLN